MGERGPSRLRWNTEDTVGATATTLSAGLTVYVGYLGTKAGINASSTHTILEGVLGGLRTLGYASGTIGAARETVEVAKAWRVNRRSRRRENNGQLNS